MTDKSHALISLKDKFATGILNGDKLVELRRRPMRLTVGTTIWIYVKVPVGKVVGSARIRCLDASPPRALWRAYGEVSGLNKDEFFDYFSGVDHGFGLVLENPERLDRPITLQRLRDLNQGFQPPQFFLRLANDGALVAAFNGGMRQRVGGRRAMCGQTVSVAAA